MTDGVTLVLGAGSPLMGDDGLGVEVVETISRGWIEGPTLQFLDGGVWGMRLLPQIEQADRMIVVDAVKAGREPGTLVRLEHEEIPRYLRNKISPHQIDLSEVFAVAELRGTFPPVAVALGIEPEQVEAYEPISEVVRRTVPDLIEAVEAQLVSWGHQAARRDDEAEAREPPASEEAATRA
ncbi:MAG: HyaD/HybD family hydrogenase maturation endopeptidase [Gemmatimonadota bacterium]|jgi:hydrogenase maturation protease